MADIAKYDEDMEYGMNIGYLLETVHNSTGNVCDPLSRYPQHYRKSATVI